MNALVLFLSTMVIWLVAAVLWFIGWWAVLGLWVALGPQDPFADVGVWLNLSIIAMTVLVIFAGARATAAAFRLLAK